MPLFKWPATKPSPYDSKAIKTDLFFRDLCFLSQMIYDNDFIVTRNEQETNYDNENTENENQISTNTENTEESDSENLFGFEQPLKKIKLEDQSEEIRKLKQVNKNLKEGNSQLQKEVAKLTKANEDYERVQNQNETVLKNLKEENLKLHKEILDLKYVHNGSKSGPF